MRIKELNKFENFYKILNETLLKFSSDPDLSHLFLIKTSRERYVNDYLNYIICSDTPSLYLRNLFKEYSYTSVLWRKSFQKFYTYLAIQKFTRNLISKRIDLSVKISSNVIIMGGNHRIRLYDYIDDAMYVLLKNNENELFIKNEISFRKQYNPQNAPIFLGNGNLWFKEEFITGRPLNRFPDQKFFVKMTHQILEEHIKNFILPNTKYINLEEYLEIIIIKINDKLAFLGDVQLIKYVPEIITRIKDLLKNYYGLSIPISISHGDFQYANIIVYESNRYKIIDWESISERFSYYDEFVFSSNVRHKFEILNLINNFSLNQNQNIYSKLSILNKEIVKQLLILEEILFNLYDIKNSFNTIRNNKLYHLITSIYKNFKNNDSF